MENVKKELVFEVEENLLLTLKSERLNVSVIGEDTKQCKISLEIPFEKHIDEKLIKAEYDKVRNELSVNFGKFEDKYHLNKAEIKLFVPFKTSLQFKSERGNISILQLEGKQDISNETGKITVEKIKGNLEIKTENGAIKISTIVGNIELSSENAMIRLSKAKGDIKLKSENSMIKISDSSGKLKSVNENGMIRVVNSTFDEATIKNENGSIYYETGFFEKGSLNFENEHGKIHLILPKDLQYDITTKNKRGIFKIGVEGSMEKSTEGSFKVIHIVKGNGNVKIITQNEIGSIKISNEPIKSGVDKVEEIISSVAMDGILSKGLEKSLEKGEEIIEKNMKKLEKNMEKIEKKIKSYIEENEDKFTDKGEKIAQKVKEKLNDAINKAFTVISEKEKPDTDEINKRSRMKILQMLQDGKITAEQAEKLLKALEKNNE